jgi:L-threonylcarbamoyladenylate synthase
MRTIKYIMQNRESLDKAVQAASIVLKNGGIAVYPTDTAYGLGANALNESAICKIFAIKERDRKKPLSITVRDIEMAKRYAIISAAAEEFLKQAWPGAITVVLRKRSLLPDILIDGGTIGIRMPDHEFHESLFKRIDFPITATSANISGNESVWNIADFKRQLRGRTCRPDLVIDAGALPPTHPSTVIDLSGQEPKILRTGPISKKTLLEIFNKTL